MSELLLAEKRVWNVEDARVNVNADSQYLGCFAGEWKSRVMSGAPESREWVYLTLGGGSYYFRLGQAYILMPCRTRESLHVIPWAGGVDSLASYGLTVANGNEDMELSELLDALHVAYSVASSGRLIIVNSGGRFKWKINR